LRGNQAASEKARKLGSPGGFTRSFDHKIIAVTKMVVRLSFLCRKSTWYSVDVVTSQAGSSIGNGQTFFPMLFRCQALMLSHPKSRKSNIRALKGVRKWACKNQESWELLWNN
jgi:hypothetical protein